jgi:hypothetical protein
MPGTVKVALLTVLTATAFVGGFSQAWASCKSGICVSGRDDGRIHRVSVRSENGFTHFNVILPGGKQIDVRTGEEFSFRVFPSDTYSYSVQGCVPGSFLMPSSCTKWVVFEHTVR